MDFHGFLLGFQGWQVSHHLKRSSEGSYGEAELARA